VGNFVFNLVASNGQNILSGESYKSKRAALNGIESVRKNSGKKSNYEERMGENKKPRLNCWGFSLGNSMIIWK
jgi:uncharacterized protein YegP (UPF0339 family)